MNGRSNLSRRKNIGAVYLTLFVLFTAAVAQASPIAGWAFQDSGTTASIGSGTGRALDVWLNGFAVARGTDNVIRIREPGSDVWTALDVAAPYYHYRDSLAITSDKRFYVGTHGHKDSSGYGEYRRVCTFEYNENLEDWVIRSYQPAGANDRIIGVWADRSEASSVAIASVQGKGIYHAWSGTTGWKQVDTDTVSYYFSTGSQANNIIGTKGQTRVFRSTNGGQSFTEIAAGAEEIPFDPMGVTAAGDDFHWICGANGEIAFWDASAENPAYVMQSTPTTKRLRSMWAVSPTSVWAVGDDATVLYYDGTEWSSVDLGLPGLGDGDHFYNVAADALGNPTIAGTKGTIIAGMIPEPGTCILFLSVLSGLAFYRLRQKRD